LSGGLDSSALTALADPAARRAVRRPVRSFADRLRRPAGELRRRRHATHARTPRSCTTWPSTCTPSTRTSCWTHNALADPAVRRTVLTARDMPTGLRRDGRVAATCCSRRSGSTRRVALYGESARRGVRRLTGGSRAGVQRAKTPFPWLARHQGVRSGQPNRRQRYTSPGADVRIGLQGTPPGQLHPKPVVPRSTRCPASPSHDGADAGDVLPAPDPFRPRYCWTARTGLSMAGRAGGPGAVLRPPAGRVRLQHAVVDEDVRRQGEEPAARRDPGRAAAISGRTGEKSISVDPRSAVHGGAATAGQGNCWPTTTIRFFAIHLAELDGRSRGPLDASKLDRRARQGLERALDLATWLGHPTGRRCERPDPGRPPGERDWRS